MALSPNINIMMRAAEKAAKSLLRDFGEVEQLQVSKKGPGDFVSAADHRAEEIIHAELSRARPEYGFLMEEQGQIEGQNPDCKWIIDPLDGTSNFLHGIPHWCISIALEENNKVIAGIVYAPVVDEMYRAERGNGAFIRNKRLRVSGRMSLDRAMIATGAPKRAQDDQDIFIREYEAVQSLAPGIRRFGAAALDIAYVAAGRCEAFWERNLNPWDIAAGDIILREAGGRISDIDTEQNPIYTGNVLAANAEIYDEIRKTLKNANKGKDAA
jgi:myo-inositol-1(or 4)-monophosphatase